MEVPTHIDSLTLVEALHRSAQTFNNAPAISFMGQTRTFAEVDQLSDRVAAGLLQQGVCAGDRVALYCINSDAFVLAYFGILKTGATVLPINLLLTPHEVEFILKDAGASALIYHEAVSAPILTAAAECPEIRFSCCIGTPPPDSGSLLFSELLSCPDTLPDISINSRETVAAILYTSGTTGHPKGAMLTHRNLITDCYGIDQVLDTEPGQDAFMVVLPMFHAFAATACMLYPLLHGIRIIPLPRYNPEETALTIEKELATLFMGVPSMYNLLNRLPERFTPALRSLRYGISGGAAMPAEVMNAFEKRFGVLIYEGDGPTECAPATCFNPIGGKRKPASVGLPIPLVEMKILDDAGNELPHNEIGELCVRGPNVMKGYWQQPEQTAESFFGDWFRTGDLATEDDEGYFFIVDRKKDMVIVNGMNVYPRVIEEVLYTHPDIHEAAVIGEPHPSHGEIPVAYITTNDGTPLSIPELRTFCREFLGKHEIPRKFFFVERLPKNAAGKIIKRELRKHGELERGIDARTTS